MAIRMIIIALLLVMGCGKDGYNDAGSIKYYLENAATSTLSNTFLLDVQGDFKPSFSLSGTGYTASIPLDTVTPFSANTVITAETFGTVKVLLTLYQENGKPYLTDTLIWQSSGEVPPPVRTYFSELASADAYVYLVFPMNRGKNTQEVWVEGDVVPAAGKYYPIPSDDQVLIELSPGDGLKTVRVKYRNIFGAHSELVSLSIPRKSQGPINCQALPVATKTATGSIRTRIQATNDGPLYYKVSGDVAIEKDYVSFTNSIEDYIGLSAGEGVKRIAVKIKDEAGNACDTIKLTISYDRSYLPGSLTIAGNPIWTDDPAITIRPHFDHLEGDVIEMYVGGGVSTAANTFAWIPYQESLAVALSPTNGTRHVIVQFRKMQTVVSEVSSTVFLRPYLFISGTGSSRVLMPSDIIGSTQLTLSGCVETYDHVPYQETFPCTPAAAQATATYFLSDGTLLLRSVTF